MAKLSREKGKRGERQAARHLSEVLGVDVTRAQQYKGNAGAADLAGTLGLHCEVKRTERLRLYEAMEQADQDAGEDSIPLLLHRRNRKPWTVTVYLSDLRAMVAEVNRLRDLAERIA